MGTEHYWHYRHDDSGIFEQSWRASSVSSRHEKSSSHHAAHSHHTTAPSRTRHQRLRLCNVVFIPGWSAAVGAVPDNLLRGGILRQGPSPPLLQAERRRQTPVLQQQRSQPKLRPHTGAARAAAGAQRRVRLWPKHLPEVDGRILALNESLANTCTYGFWWWAQHLKRVCMVCLIYSHWLWELALRCRDALIYGIDTHKTISFVCLFKSIGIKAMFKFLYFLNMNLNGSNCSTKKNRIPLLSQAPNNKMQFAVFYCRKIDVEII